MGQLIVISKNENWRLDPWVKILKQSQSHLEWADHFFYYNRQGNAGDFYLELNILSFGELQDCPRCF